MKILSGGRWVLAVLAMLSAMVAAPAQVVTYRFDATLTDVSLGKQEGSNLFGITEGPFDFSATLTFDLTAHPAVRSWSIGQEFEGFSAAHPIYVFSAATVVAGTVTVGNHTWTLDEMRENTWDGTTYAITANTNLATAPTLLRIEFEDADGNFIGLGAGTVGSSFELTTDATIRDSAGEADAYGYVTAVSAVPEPSTYAAIAGMAALVGVAWRRRAQLTSG